MGRKYELVEIKDEPFPWFQHIMMCVLSAGLWIPIMVIHLWWRKR